MRQPGPTAYHPAMLAQTSRRFHAEHTFEQSRQPARHDRIPRHTSNLKCISRCSLFDLTLLRFWSHHHYYSLSLEHELVLIGLRMAFLQKDSHQPYSPAEKESPQRWRSLGVTDLAEHK